ncbi:uroporphyrinogen-III C-methyltransferase [Vibrio sp. UCD-FRSSP16_10]|uniref:uroporphyrinogen-III C-methyltransferase n=1 Tax=unclassified Vibrio TaxID=2614977 RepID=UPI00080015D4|nr:MULTISPECIES: uroporphyrinogen-III C-methyltransferase [unclassified Vibrio]OBT15569.1 uroporphyrinogen-III C-methyltransferase [Vibrio sp. UCD-FRSSP16_30]OBT20642.1 uroporphyrinogen-III C-methyltransferase [Vibrio sp. UCD-FRSSP16_10]
MQAQGHYLGRVTLVGAGPGDPDLLTVKASRVIQQASFIMYDNLVSSEIRALFPDNAEKVFVGKAKGEHSSTQDQINALLLQAALAGKDVCRVKGGDSFVFGRGGEEMLMLAQNGIEVDVVPGITAASGCTSYADIPLTHRGLAQGCTFITAHADKKLDINWTALAQLKQTLVFYMGLSKTDMLIENLTTGGLSANTPIAFIENGCTPQQRVIIGKLDQLTSLKEQHQIKSPALIVVGEVVSVAKQMDWLTALSHRQPQHFEYKKVESKQPLQLTA